MSPADTKLTLVKNLKHVATMKRLAEPEATQRKREGILKGYCTFAEKKGVQWSEWNNLKGVFASAPKITIVQNSEGLTNVFARGIDRQYYVRAQTGSRAAGVSWKGWESLGGIWAGGPVLVQNSNDHLELFGRGTDLSIWHKTAEKTEGEPFLSTGSLLVLDVFSRFVCRY